MAEQTIETNDSKSSTDSISLLDLVLVVAKRWRFIVFFTAAAMVLLVLFSVYTLKVPADSAFNPLPNIYLPAVKVRLQDSASSNTLSSILGSSSEMSLLSSLTGITGNTSQSANLAQALLVGNTLIDEIAEEFSFVDYYKIEKYPKSSARKIFKESISMEFDASTGILTIGYMDVDPEFATRVVNRILELLELRIQELTMERIQTKRVFLEERIKQVWEAVKKAQDDLIAFQQKHGIVDIEFQAQQQITEIAQLNSEIVSMEMELQALKEYRRSDDPQILRLANDIELKRSLLAMKKQGFTQFASEDIPSAALPEISAMYLNLVRDLKIQETVYASLRQQYETTKLEEADDSKTFQIIERAEVPEIKDRPSRGKLCVIGSISALFLSIFITFILEYMERVKRDPTESRKLASIREKLPRLPSKRRS